MIPWKLPLFMKTAGFHEKWQFSWKAVVFTEKQQISLGNLIDQLIQDKSFSFIVCLGEAMSDDSMKTTAFHENCWFSWKVAVFMKSSGFHWKAAVFTRKPYKSTNSRQILQFHCVLGGGYVWWFHENCHFSWKLPLFMKSGSFH